MSAPAAANSCTHTPLHSFSLPQDFFGKDGAMGEYMKHLDEAVVTLAAERPSLSSNPSSSFTMRFTTDEAGSTMVVQFLSPECKCTGVPCCSPKATQFLRSLF